MFIFVDFFGTPISLQLTWQSYDSLLAAPLVIDLSFFVLVAQGHVETGVLSFLASFFKSPLSGGNQGFPERVRLLEAWARTYRVTAMRCRSAVYLIECLTSQKCSDRRFVGSANESHQQLNCKFFANSS